MSITPAASGRVIAERARHIKILDDGISRAVDSLYDRVDSGSISLKEIFKKTPVHPRLMDRSGVDWIFFSSLLNFSFWTREDEPKFFINYKGVDYSGYLGLCAAINRTIDQGIPLTDPAFFGSVSLEDFSGYLQGEGGVPCPMTKERHALLKETSKTLLSKYDGSFVNCVNQCDKNAVKLLSIIQKDFPCFEDKAMYDGVEVYLLKRAQILISDIWSLFEGKGTGEFNDIDSLTMFPDYRVPQSLQYFGVFKYSEELIEFLKKDELLENGSAMEVEIRGCSIEAVERIKDKFKKSSKYKESVHGFVNSPIIDYYLWGLRRELAEKMKMFPYHKTRSIYY